MSVGIGYDSHRFAASRPLILGGVEIEHERGRMAGIDIGEITVVLQLAEEQRDEP